MAQDSAKRFAELSRALHEAVPQLLGADGSPLPGLGTTDSDKGKPNGDPSYLREDIPDYQATPLNYEPSRESESDGPLWTVDQIAKDDPEKESSDVDQIIDEILAAAEDEA